MTTRPPDTAGTPAPVLAVGDGGLSAEQLASTTGLLRDGQVVVVPTETVYGVAVDPFAAGATQRLFELKGRGRDAPIAVLVADPTQAAALGRLDERAVRLVDRFWPGPLTIVVHRDPGLDLDLGVDAGTIGLRCPAHVVPRMLASRVGPLATTSANRHGDPTPRTAQEVGELFRDGVALVLDAGPCEAPPSTVVDLTGPELRVLREGRLTGEELSEALSA